MRGSAVVAVSVAAVLALGGCGGDGAAGGDDPSGAETSVESPTETPAETPTEPPEPTVEPASGPELEVSGVRVNAPKGWQQTFDSVVVDTALGRVEHQSGGLMLSASALGGEPLTPQETERYFWTRGQKPPNYQRQDPVLIGDNVRAGYYTSRDRFDDVHSFTVWADNHVVKVEVSFGRKVADATQQELLRSVLASYSGPQD